MCTACSLGANRKKEYFNKIHALHTVCMDVACLNYYLAWLRNCSLLVVKACAISCFLWCGLVSRMCWSVICSTALSLEAVNLNFLVDGLLKMCCCW